MIDHSGYQLAARNRALTLSVCTTGSISLGASVAGGNLGASAFTRAAGSFVTDGFKIGMELSATGFAQSANNGPAMITFVAATVLTVSKTLKSDGAAAARSLAVGLPSDRSWENVDFRPTQGKSYAEEQYIPGAPSQQVTLGQGGEIELMPMYSIRVSVPNGVGFDAASKYADAIENHFTPRTAIALASGDVLRVSDRGSFRGQQQPGETGFSVIPVTIPFWLRTFNSI